MANIRSLENAFEVGKKNSEMIEEINEMRQELDDATQALEDNKSDPDDILYKNIERANNLLDTAQREIDNGDISARMLEVCSQLINSVTTAANSIVGVSSNDAELEYKHRMADIKEQEVLIKKAVSEHKMQSIPSPSTVNNNLIVTSREKIMEMINSQEGLED